MPTTKLVNGKAYSIISDHLGTPILAFDSESNEVWNRQLDIYGRVRKEYKHSSLGDEVFPFVPFLYQGQYYDFETNLAYNRFRYYSPETGAYISQDPIGLAGGNPTLYGYVKDSNWWVDVFGLTETEKANELVYQLRNEKNEVVYYGITSRDAVERLKEHMYNEQKKGDFVTMEILAEKLTHDEARSIEGALIRKKWQRTHSISYLRTT